MGKRNEQTAENISEETEDQKLKECFIITPIGKNGTTTFQKTEGLINSVLTPVLREHGFYPLPAHHIDSSGSINKQIIEKVVNCELVIANLTEINPNVMYELAIRHSFGKKVITLAENDTKLPFDIIDQRTIFYDDSMLGVDRLKPALSKAIGTLLREPSDVNSISNPVYDAVKQLAVINSLPVEQQDALSIVMGRLDSMDQQLLMLNRIYSNDALDNRKNIRESKSYMVILHNKIPDDEIEKLQMNLLKYKLKIESLKDEDDSTTLMVITSSFNVGIGNIVETLSKLGLKVIRVAPTN